MSQPNVWISKKTRQEVKERRKKKRKHIATLGTVESTIPMHDSNEEKSANVNESLKTKKRRLNSSTLQSSITPTNASVKSTSTHENSSVDPIPILTETKSHTIVSPHTVLIPNGISSKEAKKLRKITRRIARKNGQNESKIRFVHEADVHAPSSIQEDYKQSKRPSSKKSTKTFPKINEILAQHAKMQASLAKKLHQESAEAQLSPQIKSQYVAIDCEMVGVGVGGKLSALARVSIIDWYGSVLLDTFVQVPERVTDFRTHVSGVRPSDIQIGKEETSNPTLSSSSSSSSLVHSKQAMELQACRHQVGQLLKGKIVVGHALHNDFKALMLDHPKEDRRDTARYKPFMKTRGKNGGKLHPRKLRDLVKEHVVGMEIQREGEAHSSVEDAIGTMELYKTVREVWEQSILEEKKKKKRRI